MKILAALLVGEPIFRNPVASVIVLLVIVVWLQFVLLIVVCNMGAILKELRGRKDGGRE